MTIRCKCYIASSRQGSLLPIRSRDLLLPQSVIRVYFSFTVPARIAVASIESDEEVTFGIHALTLVTHVDVVRVQDPLGDKDEFCKDCRVPLDDMLLSRASQSQSSTAVVSLFPGHVWNSQAHGPRLSGNCTLGTEDRTTRQGGSSPSLLAAE